MRRCRNWVLYQDLLTAAPRPHYQFSNASASPFQISTVPIPRSFQISTVPIPQESANVRYVIAGGFAVNLHGFLRFTKDLDLLVDLDPDNALLAMNVFSACGLRPRVPVPATDFANAAKRDDWFENRNMIVFQVWRPQDPTCTVDLFIRNPIDFNDLWTRSSRANLGSTPCRFASIDDLVAMKTDAGRPQDLRDIEELRRLQRLALEVGAPTPPRSTDDLP